jgi:hypothetical protein
MGMHLSFHFQHTEMFLWIWVVVKTGPRRRGVSGVGRGGWVKRVAVGTIHPVVSLPAGGDLRIDVSCDKNGTAKTRGVCWEAEEVCGRKELLWSRNDAPDGYIYVSGDANGNVGGGESVKRRERRLGEIITKQRSKPRGFGSKDAAGINGRRLGW